MDHQDGPTGSQIVALDLLQLLAAFWSNSPKTSSQAQFPRSEISHQFPDSNDFLIDPDLENA